MISVVMMSYLGEYPGSRSNPIPKFNRAVQSVLNQTYKDFELIIVSDGCELTNKEYESNWKDNPKIRLIKTEKSESKWPGSKRQIGADHAKYEWVTYLDSDDVYTTYRLQKAFEAIQSSDKDVIFDDVMSIAYDITKVTNARNSKTLKVTSYNSIVEPDKSNPMPELGPNIYEYPLTRKGTQTITGTFRIFHKRSIKTKWKDLHKSGEDNAFIRNLMLKESFETKPISGYIITHSSARGFDI